MGTPLTEQIPGIHGGYNGAVTGENGSFKMTLTLKDKDGKEIFRREPDGEECWITGFKPSYQNPIVEELTAETEIQFDTDVAGAQKKLDLAQETYDNAVSQYGKDSFEVSRAYKQLESAAINLDEKNIEKQAFDGLYQKYEVEKKKDELAEDVTLKFDESAHTMTITMGKSTENRNG